jgi:2-octaprenylphenol hydroxylase
MSAIMQGFRTLFTPQPPLVELMRGLGMRAVDQCAPVKQHLMLYAMGLRGELPPLLRRPSKI